MGRQPGVFDSPGPQGRELIALFRPFGKGQDSEHALAVEFHAGRDLSRQLDFGDGLAKGRGDSPQVGGVFLAAGENVAAVGAKGDEPDLALVTKSWPKRPAGGRVPELSPAVVAAGQDRASVGTDRQGRRRPSWRKEARPAGRSSNPTAWRRGPIRR